MYGSLGKFLKIIITLMSGMLGKLLFNAHTVDIKFVSPEN